jgi:hypothetical protein
MHGVEHKKFTFDLFSLRCNGVAMNICGSNKLERLRKEVGV